MSVWNRTIKYVLTALAVLVGAMFFYLAGVGTGLQVAHTTLGVSSAADLVSSATTAIPTVGNPSATRAPLPATTATPAPQPSENGQDSFGIFWEAWDVLEQEFYGELPDGSELPYAAIEGVISATGDPYTAFLDPVRAEILRTDLQGGFEGIGATVRLRPDGKLEVVQPLPGWPAIQAGLRAKDVILEVDEVEIQGMSLYEAISLIRGPAGTVVHLLIERGDVYEPLEIEIERAHIELPVIESEVLENDIGYVRLSEFGETAADDLGDALRELDPEELRGLIFDLRGNRGGFLSTAVEVTSQFVGEGPILVERFRDGREQRYPAMRGGLALDVPLVVLVDGSSASASEIAAGAIQDTDRGVLIGTTTLGKGSVQMVHALSDGSELRVTIARWFTPEGRAIHGEGLEPDIEVELTEDDVLAERDPQLERAIDYLLEGE
jgi:carboxyl-terminal processing protease